MQAIVRDPLFEQAMVVGNNRPYIVTLVVVNPQQWLRFCRSLQADAAAPAVRDDPAVRQALLERVRKATLNFPYYARPLNAALCPGPWTVEDGLLTGTLKLRRSAIARRFSRLIEALYAEDNDYSAPYNNLTETI